MSKEQFLDPSTGSYKRLDDTAWYIKNRDGKPCYVYVECAFGVHNDFFTTSSE